MGLPYENATSGGAALEDIRKLLTKFGCDRFGTMTDQENGELIVQFTYRGRDITAKATGVTRRRGSRNTPTDQEREERNWRTKPRR